MEEDDEDAHDGHAEAALQIDGEGPGTDWSPRNFSSMFIWNDWMSCEATMRKMPRRVLPGSLPAPHPLGAPGKVAMPAIPMPKGLRNAAT